MSTNIGIGFSDAQDPQEAAFQACAQAKNQLKSINVDLSIIFTSPHYARPEILAVIASVLKPRRLIGSSSGTLILPHGIAQRGILIWAMNSDEIHGGIGAMENLNNGDLRLIGFELARRCNNDLSGTHRQAGLVFCHQMLQESSPFIHGIHEAWGAGFPMIGAVSSDDLRFKQSCQYFQHQKLSNAAVGLLWGGDLTVAFSSRHSFKPLGKPRIITQSQGNIINTIDHKPAVHMYENYLTSEGEQLKKSFINSHAGLYPLGVYTEAERQYLLRNPVDILPEGSIVCQGDVPQGAEVHLMISNKDACRQSAMAAAQEVNEGLDGRAAKQIFIFQSMARRKIQGRNAWAEIQLIKDVLGHNTPMIGMYSYGELAPFGSMDSVRQIYMHNGNILIFAIA